MPMLVSPGWLGKMMSLGYLRCTCVQECSERQIVYYSTMHTETEKGQKEKVPLGFKFQSQMGGKFLKRSSQWCGGDVFFEPVNSSISMETTGWLSARPFG